MSQSTAAWCRRLSVHATLVCLFAAVHAAERKVTFYDMDQFSVVASSNVESHKPRSLKFGPDKATVLVASDGSLKVILWSPVLRCTACAHSRLNV